MKMKMNRIGKIARRARLCVGALAASLAAGSLWAAPAEYNLRFDQTYPGFLQRTELTVWQGRSIGEIVTLQARMHGEWIGSAPIDAVGFIYDRTEEGFSVQFQAMQGVRKAVRARFRQSGDNIVAVADKFGYDAAPAVGTRMADSVFTQDAATSATGMGYGVFDIVAGTSGAVAGLPADAADGLVVNVGHLTVEAA